MLTLKELLANMAATGRDLTPRAARDWWTKGILSKPQRRWRRRGSETFWTETSETRRAQIAYDLLAMYPRAGTTILGVWLHGFPVKLVSIRKFYLRSIDDHFRLARGRSQQPLSEWVGKLAGMVARRVAKTNAAPKAAQDAIEDLAIEFLGVFYEPREEFSGLASHWEIAAPYLGGAALGQNGEIAFHPQDDDLATWAQYLGEMASLTAQRRAIASATDYELMRARRLVLFAFKCLDRVVGANLSREQFEEFGTRAIVDFGRPALPILIAVLRNEALRQQVVSFVLEGAKVLRQLQWRLPRACQ
jgi:hypothetical protein